MTQTLDYQSPPLPVSDDVRPLVELLTLAGPTVVQMASYTLMQFVDTLMLSRVGIDEPTAAANSGHLAFSVMSFGIGVLWVVNTLASQSFGRKEFTACGRYLWQGIWFAVIFSALLAPAMYFAEAPYRGFGHSANLVRLEGGYFRVALSFTLVKLIGTALGQFLLAVNRPGAVLASAACGVGINALAAWALIFGHLGFHPHGVLGSAWGQNVGVTVESAVLAACVLAPAVRRKFNVMDWRFRLAEMKTLLSVGAASGAQILADVLAWGLFGLWVMGQFGTRAMAANTFMFRYMVVSFMPAFGLGVAVTALVGRYIGAGRPDLAAQRAKLAFKVAAIYMTVCGLFFFLGRNLLIGLFTKDPDIRRTGALLLTFAAVYQFFDAMYIVYNGALRGAGDTLVPAVATMGLCWGITVFGGYAIARVFPRFGPAGPWLLATGYGVILGVFMYRRFKRGGWREIRLGGVSNVGADSNTVNSTTNDETRTTSE